MNVTSLTKDALAGMGLSNKEVERSKNMFVLGLLYWIFDQSPDFTIKFIQEKFTKDSLIAQANINALKAGWNYGDNTEILNTMFKITASD